MPFFNSIFNVGYAGAGGSINSQALSGFNSWSGTATMDLYTRWELVSRSRQLYISSPIASAVVERMTAGIIGAGLEYQTAESSDLFDDKDQYIRLSKSIKRSFKLASHFKRLDVQGRLSFPQMQELACRNWLLSGDVFFVRYPDTYAWRAVESDRVQTPYCFAVSTSYYDDVYNPDTGNRVIDGVEIDGDGKAVAYWILKDYIQSPFMVEPSQIERIPACDDSGLPLVLHIYKPLRPDQYRGIPILSGIIETLHSVKNYTQAELQAAALQAAVFGFIQSENPTMDETEPLSSRDLDEPIPTENTNNSDNTGSDNGVENKSTQEIMQISTDYANPDDRIFYNKILPKPKTVNAGQIVHLSENEKIQFLQSTHPNQNYKSFIDATHTDVAASVGIPEKALSCSYDGTYSSSRAAVLESNRLFKNMRKYFIDTFCRPVLEMYIYESVKNTMEDPEMVAACMGIDSMWQAPTALCLDPKVELEGWKLAIDMGLVDSDEAALALYGHKAVSHPEPAIQIDKDIV